jgi:hypothetical protein
MPGQGQLTIVKSEPLTVASSVPDERPEGLDFYQNFKNSATGFLGNVAGAVASPVRTGTAMLKLAAGGASKAVGSDARNPLQQFEPYADAAGQFYKDRYGSGQAIKHTLLTDPVGAMADASTVLTPLAGVAKAGATVMPRLAATARIIDTAAAVAKAPVRAAGGAEALQNMATEKRLAALLPVTGANKGKLAAKAAPLVEELGSGPEFKSWTKQGLHRNLEAKAASSHADMESAIANAQGSSGPSAPLLAEIRKELDSLTVNGFIPTNNAERFDTLTRAYQEIAALGPSPTFADVRTLRMSWDRPKKEAGMFYPSHAEVKSTPGEIEASGTAADAMRGHLASLDNDAAKAMSDCLRERRSPRFLGPHRNRKWGGPLSSHERLRGWLFSLEVGIRLRKPDTR